MMQQPHLWANIQKNWKQDLEEKLQTIAASFTVGKRWKQTECPLIDEWI